MKKLGLIISISFLIAAPCRMAYSSPLDQSFDEWDDAFPVVLSATRLRQPRSEVPASMTVIDAQTIRELGIRTLAEVFRLVPGMYVGYERGHIPEVGYHTLSAENSRHLQVLIDGRSIYQQALARILWDDLPLSLDKISRIEVVRGPNTAMFGANSYLAVINIITYQPEDRLGSHVSFTSGNKGINDGHFSYGKQIGNYSFDINLGYHSDDGFEIGRNDEERFDAHQGRFLAGDWVWQPNLSDSLRIQWGFSDNDKQVDGLEAGEVGDYHNVNTQNSFTQINWQQTFSNESELKIQAFATNTVIDEDWQTCGPALLFSSELFDLFTLDPFYTEELLAALNNNLPPPSATVPEVASQALRVLQRLQNNGTATVCGTANQDLTEQRLDFEAQFTHSLNQSVRWVGGLSYREDQADSETYFSGNVGKDIWRVFSHFEVRPTPNWLFNLGAMYEHDSLVGSELSPRLSANWLISPRQSVRFIYSRANRSPDLFEVANQRSFTIRDLSQPVNGSDDFARFYQHEESNKNLNYEQIISREIGWYFRNEQQTIEIDIKAYADKLFQLLEGVFLDNNFSFGFLNQGRIDVSGIEAQIDWNASNQFTLRATGSKVDQTDATLPFYLRSGADSTWTLNGFYKISPNLNFSSSFYYYRDWFSVDFKRMDTSLIYQMNFQKITLAAKLGYQHRFDDNHLLDLRSRYTNPDKIYATLSLNW